MEGAQLAPLAAELLAQHGQRDLLVAHPPLIPLGAERVEEARRVAANTDKPALRRAKDEAVEELRQERAQRAKIAKEQAELEKQG